MQALQPNAPLGPYKLLRLLAQGGMGQVFLADGPEGRVVVKVLQPDLAAQSEMRSMFLHEARLGATLDHESIAQIYDYGDAEGVLYLAMEFVDGPPLSTILRRLRRKLPLAATLQIVADVASALGHAHAAVDDSGEPLRIVHRDVTPQNVLVSQSTGKIKLIDFGVARSSGQDHRTRTGVLKGKLAYMAPEQFRGKVNNQTDIFALGVILHELVSGKRLFRRPTEAETFAAILVDPLPPLKADQDVVQVIRPIVERALARELDRRYPDARLLEADLRRAMATLGLACGPSDISKLASIVSSMPPLETDRPAEADAQGDAFTSTSGLRLRPEDIEELSDLSDLYFNDTMGSNPSLSGTPGTDRVNELLRKAAEVRKRDAEKTSRDVDVEGMGRPMPLAHQRRIATTPIQTHEQGKRVPLMIFLLALLLTLGVVVVAWKFPTPPEPMAAVPAPAVTPSAPAAVAPQVVPPALSSQEQVPPSVVPVVVPSVTTSVVKNGSTKTVAKRRREPTVVATQAQTQEEPSPVAAVGTGLLCVRTDPWSNVYLGRVLLGQSPFANVEVPAGVQTFKLVGPDGVERRKTLRITADPPCARIVGSLEGIPES